MAEETDIYSTFPLGLAKDDSFALTISHPNFLTCRWIGENIVRYDNYESTFSDCISYLEREHEIKPIKLCEYDNDLNKVSYNVVQEKYRAFTSHMIQFLIYLHGRGKSLGPSALSVEHNFVVTNDVLQFRCVSFREADKDTKRNDFKLIFDVLTSEVFHNDEKNLPYDMQDLLTLISEVCYKEENELLIANHLAIMPPVMRICFCRNIWERRNLLSQDNAELYQEAVLKIGSFKKWAQNFKNKTKFSFLEDCFYRPFPSGELATDEEITRVYHDACPTKFETSCSFLKFCRNMAAHLPEVCTGQVPVITDTDIDVIMMQYFGVTVTKLQNELHKKTLLPFFWGCSTRQW